MIGVLWYGGYLVITGHMSVGVLTSFILYTITVAMAVGGLASLYGGMSSSVCVRVRTCMCVHVRVSALILFILYTITVAMAYACCAFVCLSAYVCLRMFVYSHMYAKSMLCLFP